MDWTLIGDLFLCLCLVCGAALFIAANVNYLQENNDTKDDR